MKKLLALIALSFILVSCATGKWCWEKGADCKNDNDHHSPAYDRK